MKNPTASLRSTVQTPIASLPVSKQTINKLHGNGIRTVGQVSLLTKKELEVIANIGPHTLNQLEQALSLLGHNLLHEDADAMVKAIMLYSSHEDIPARVIISRKHSPEWWKLARTLNDYTLGKLANESPKKLADKANAVVVLSDVGRNHIQYVLRFAGINPRRW